VQPPEASGVATPTNPLLNLQGGLTVTASLVSGNLTTKDVQREMVAAGFPSSYAIAVNPGSGPLLSLTTLDNDPIRAIAARDELLVRLKQELSRIQSDSTIPSAQIIHAEVFSVNAEAEVVPGSKLRAIAVIVGVGLTATLVVAFARDKALRGRTRTRSRSRGRGRAARPERPAHQVPDDAHASESHEPPSLVEADWAAEQHDAAPASPASPGSEQEPPPTPPGYAPGTGTEVMSFDDVVRA